MRKKVIAAFGVALVGLVVSAQAAVACWGYWDCTPMEGGDYCLCYGEC